MHDREALVSALSALQESKKAIDLAMTFVQVALKAGGECAHAVAVDVTTGGGGGRKAMCSDCGTIFSPRGLNEQDANGNDSVEAGEAKTADSN